MSCVDSLVHVDIHATQQGPDSTLIEVQLERAMDLLHFFVESRRLSLDVCCCRFGDAEKSAHGAIRQQLGYFHQKEVIGEKVEKRHLLFVGLSDCHVVD